MTATAEVITVPGLDTVIRLHRRNARVPLGVRVQIIKDRRAAMRRPTNQDRADNRDERLFRRRQPEPDLIIEQAEYTEHERATARARYEHEATQPYAGSMDEALHRERGRQ